MFVVQNLKCEGALGTESYIQVVEFLVVAEFMGLESEM